MSDISNKPLDKEGIIKRLAGQGFAFSKKPEFLPPEDEIKNWLNQVKEGNLTEQEVFNNIKNAAKTDHDFLQGMLFTVNMSECLNIKVPTLKKETGFLLMDQCRYTALELANPDMTDLAQVYFQELEDKENWVKAHAATQDAFPDVFEMANDLKETHNKIEAWKKENLGKPLDDQGKTELNNLVATYLTQTVDLMDLFSMLDPMYCAKKIDEYFEQFKEFEEHYTQAIKNALKGFEETDPNFDDLRKLVEEL